MGPKLMTHILALSKSLGRLASDIDTSCMFFWFGSRFGK